MSASSRKHLELVESLDQELARPAEFFHAKGNCKKEASKYRNREHFIRDGGDAAVVAINKGWLEEFFPKADEYAQRRKTWFLTVEGAKVSKTTRAFRYQQGEASGYRQATEDFVNGTVTAEFIESLKSFNVADYHALGFRVGYLQKLAELEAY